MKTATQKLRLVFAVLSASLSALAGISITPARAADMPPSMPPPRHVALVPFFTWNGAYIGIAPNANLVNLRVLNSQGVGSTSAVLSALDWLLTNRTTYNVRVANLSLGMPAVDSYKNDPVCKAVRRLVDAGVVVTVWLLVRVLVVLSVAVIETRPGKRNKRFEEAGVDVVETLYSLTRP